MFAGMSKDFGDNSAVEKANYKVHVILQMESAFEKRLRLRLVENVSRKRDSFQQVMSLLQKYWLFTLQCLRRSMERAAAQERRFAQSALASARKRGLLKASPDGTLNQVQNRRPGETIQSLS
jgi:hypothetical protein